MTYEYTWSELLLSPKYYKFGPRPNQILMQEYCNLMPKANPEFSKFVAQYVSLFPTMINHYLKCSKSLISKISFDSPIDANLISEKFRNILVISIIFLISVLKDVALKVLQKHVLFIDKIDPTAKSRYSTKRNNQGSQVCKYLCGWNVFCYRNRPFQKSKTDSFRAQDIWRQ